MLFKIDVYIVKVDPKLIPSIKARLFEDSHSRIETLRSRLEDRTQMNTPVPCALEGISAISKDDDCLRLIQLLRRHDSKRVKEIVRERLQTYMKDHPQYSSVPKAVQKQITAEVRKDEIEDQVPKIIEMMLMFYSNDMIFHANSNITLFKPYLSSAANSPIIFLPVCGGIDPDDWEKVLSESDSGDIDGLKLVLDKPINHCDVTLFLNSDNRIKITSKRQLNPSIVYETWVKAIQYVKEKYNAGH